MVIQVSIRTEGIKPVQDLLGKLSGKEARVAYAKALNDVGYKVRRQMQAEMKTVFDRPTSYILKSSFVQQATPEKLSVRIAPENQRDSPGVDPQKILQAQEFGGRRRDKRSEVAFRRVGILPAGYQTAIPKEPLAGSDDGKGNLKGSFLVQLISYFRAFSEQGSKANMTDAKKKAMHKGTKKQQEAGPFNGRRYFITYGRLRGGSRMTRKGDYDERASNLKPGIWVAFGNGKTVRPVLMFVRAANYRPRLSMERIAKSADLQNYLDKRVRFRIREAAGV